MFSKYFWIIWCITSLKLLRKKTRHLESSYKWAKKGPWILILIRIDRLFCFCWIMVLHKLTQSYIFRKKLNINFSFSEKDTLLLSSFLDQIKIDHVMMISDFDKKKLWHKKWKGSRKCGWSHFWRHCYLECTFHLIIW